MGDKKENRQPPRKLPDEIPKPYSIAEFEEEDGDLTVQVLPENWFLSVDCKEAWYPFFKSSGKFYNAVRCMITPNNPRDIMYAGKL